MNLKREAINALWTLWPRSARVRIGDAYFRVPLQRGFDRRLFHRDREPWLTELLSETCRSPESVVIDVGANCGQTLLQAKAVNPDLRYLGFEPNPACAGYVQSLIAINQLSSAEIYPCALGAEQQVGGLYTTAAADPSATIIANFRGSATGNLRLSVLVERGDDLLTRLNLSRVDLIKIDVEGAEAAVVAGIAATIERFRPTIVCEVLSSHGPEHPAHELRRHSKEELTARFSALGYQIFGIDGRQRIAVCGLSDHYRNYLLRPT